MGTGIFISLYRSAGPNNQNIYPLEPFSAHHTDRPRIGQIIKGEKRFTIQIKLI